MKRWLSFILALVLCFCLVACGEGAEPAPTEETQIPTQQQPEETVPTEESTSTPILYKVTDDAGNTAYLFGSIHVGKEDFYPLPDYVINAYESSDALAVELDILAFEKDIKAQTEALMPLIYMDGTTIKDHIPQELYDQAVVAMTKLEVYDPMLDYYCPAMWSSLIDSVQSEKTGADASLGIDIHMLNRAKADGKTILEIESAAFQYQMLADFPEALQILLLEGSIESLNDEEGAKEAMNTMMELWAAGDEEALLDFLYEETDENDPNLELYEAYDKAMVTDRNISMADFAEEVLASGQTVFICVGALHVIGEGGMADLLAQRGYDVVRVQ